MEPIVNRDFTITLSGPAGCGKTVFASHLAEFARSHGMTVKYFRRRGAGIIEMPESGMFPIVHALSPRTLKIVEEEG